MLRQIIILSIIYLLSSIEYSKAANEDYILSIANDETYGRYIIAEKRSTQGNGISVCSWTKQEADDVNFFEARDSDNSILHLRIYTNVKNNYIVGVNGNYKRDEYAVAVKDCNMKNITSWFHVCAIKNQTTIYFYLNGFPSEDYQVRENISATKSDDITIKIGDTQNQGGNSSLYQLNAFDGILTAKDVKDMYNCKFMDGDIISWKEITSQSKDIYYGENAQLIQAPVPCPTPPPYNPIDCSTGEPLQDPSNNEAGETGSSSPSEESVTSSQPGVSGSSSPSEESGTSSQPGESGSSSPFEESGTSSQPGESGSSSPSEESGTSSQPGDSGSCSPSGNSGLSSTSGNSGSSSPRSSGSE